jgi:rhodanese-related sulfurtransferase
VEPSIGCSDLLPHLGDDDVLVVDCRSFDDWTQMGLHIPGALRMTLEEVIAYAQSFPDDELIVLCGGGGVDCRKVCRILRMLGLDAVCLEGGFDRWVKLGLPTERHMTGLDARA